jgi:hypothetical protein
MENMPPISLEKIKGQRGKYLLLKQEGEAVNTFLCERI